MRPKDVAECVEIVATNPIVGPRYGAGLGRLGQIWLQLLGCEAFRPFVFEEFRITAIGPSAAEGPRPRQVIASRPSIAQRVGTITVNFCSHWGKTNVGTYAPPSITISKVAMME